jgi:hypothetical protein
MRRVMLRISMMVVLACVVTSANAQLQVVTQTSSFVYSTLGPPNSVYIFSTITGPQIGATTITVGELGVCTVAPPPYSTCSPFALQPGSGTPDDPFTFQCQTAIPVSGCTSGTPIVVPTGQQNVNTTSVDTCVTALPKVPRQGSSPQLCARSTAAPVQPLPLSPLVVVLVALGIALGGFRAIGSKVTR